MVATPPVADRRSKSASRLAALPAWSRGTSRPGTSAPVAGSAGIIAGSTWAGSRG